MREPAIYLFDRFHQKPLIIIVASVQINSLKAMQMITLARYFLGRNEM